MKHIPKHIKKIKDRDVEEFDRSIPVYAPGIVQCYEEGWDSCYSSLSEKEKVIKIPEGETCAECPLFRSHAHVGDIACLLGYKVYIYRDDGLMTRPNECTVRRVSIRPESE